MQTVKAIGKIETNAGEFLYTKRINTRIGNKSFLSLLLGGKKDLFIGTTTISHFYSGKLVYGPLTLLEPVGSYVISQFPKPREILIESEE